MTRAPWVSHFGFTRTPFSKTIAAKDLLERASHQEAVARIRFCITESSLGVVTGEVGVGKTVAVRAAVSQLTGNCRKLVDALFSDTADRSSYQQLADDLGVPMNSLGPTRARCLEKLRRLLLAAGYTD